MEAARPPDGVIRRLIYVRISLDDKHDEHGVANQMANLGPAVITSHPGIVAQAARACQAPGLPLPGRHPPGGPRATPMPRVRPHPRLHPAAHLLNRDLLAGLRGLCHLPLPPCGSTPHRGLKLKPW